MRARAIAVLVTVCLLVPVGADQALAVPLEPIVVDPPPVTVPGVDPSPVTIDPPPVGPYDLSGAIGDPSPITITPPDPDPVVIAPSPVYLCCYDPPPVNATAPPVAIAAIDPSPVGTALAPAVVCCVDPPAIYATQPPIAIAGVDPPAINATQPPIAIAGVDPPALYAPQPPIAIAGVDPPPIYVNTIPVAVAAIDPPPAGATVPGASVPGIDAPPVGGTGVNPDGFTYSVDLGPLPRLETGGITLPSECVPLGQLIYELEQAIANLPDPGPALEDLRQRLQELVDNLPNGGQIVDDVIFLLGDLINDPPPIVIEDPGVEQLVQFLLDALVLGPLPDPGEITIPGLPPIVLGSGATTSSGMTASEVGDLCLGGGSLPDVGVGGTDPDPLQIMVPDPCPGYDGCQVDAIDLAPVPGKTTQPLPVGVDLAPVPGKTVAPMTVGADLAPLPGVTKTPATVGADLAPLPGVTKAPQVVGVDLQPLPGVTKSPQVVGLDLAPLPAVVATAPPVYVDAPGLPPVFVQAPPVDADLQPLPEIDATVAPVAIDLQRPNSVTVDPPGPCTATDALASPCRVPQVDASPVTIDPPSTCGGVATSQSVAIPTGSCGTIDPSPIATFDASAIPGALDALIAQLCPSGLEACPSDTLAALAGAVQAVLDEYCPQADCLTGFVEATVAEINAALSGVGTDLSLDPGIDGYCVSGVAADLNLSACSGTGDPSQSTLTPVTQDAELVIAPVICDDAFAGDAQELCVLDSLSPTQFSLTGRVYDDATLTPIAGAQVRLVIGETILTADANVNGEFAFANIDAGSVGFSTADLQVTAPGYGQYETSNHTFQGGEGYGAGAGMTQDNYEQDMSQSGSGSGSSAETTTASSSAATYSSHSKVPPTIKMETVYDECGNKDAGVRYTDRWYEWMYYVLQVAHGEVGGSPGIDDVDEDRGDRKQYLKANVMAISNYAWYFRARGLSMDSSTTYQCFEPGRDIPSWWPDTARDALKQRIVKDGSIQKTEYKGLGSGGQHDNSCNPPYRSTSGAQGESGALYQMSQWEATYCASNGRSGGWIIDHYYDPENDRTFWNRVDGHKPDKPSNRSAGPGNDRGEVRLTWDNSTGTWHVKIQRWVVINSQEAYWADVAKVGWDSGCCIKHSYTEKGLESGRHYCYRIAAINPVVGSPSESDYTSDFCGAAK